MSAAMKGVISCLMALMMSGCLFVGADESKSDARRHAKDGSDVDFCDIYGWYNDGVCDEFCLNPDPDCLNQCAAYPACGPDQLEVDSCNGLDDCEEVTMCGSTIYCSEDVVNCLAYPACQSGYDEVEVCESYSDCYQESICGVTISCQLDTSCDIQPECPDGYYQVDDPTTCEEDLLPGCTQINECATIFCRPDPICEAIPVCPNGSTEIDSCDNTMLPCDDYTVCGTTISCEFRHEACTAIPVCGDGYVDIGASCPPDLECYEETVCGITVGCMREGQDCLAVPTCPDGFNETDVCPQNASCLRLSLCGITISCTDA